MDDVVRQVTLDDGGLGLCHRCEVTHSIEIAYRCICNRFPSSYPSFAIRCPRALKTLCGRVEIVDRRDDHALISAAEHHRHNRCCHRTTIARRPATRTRGGRTEAQSSGTAAHDVPVLPLACGPARRPALSRTLPWTMLVQRKHSSYSGSGGGAGSRSAIALRELITYRKYDALNPRETLESPGTGTKQVQRIHHRHEHF